MLRRLIDLARGRTARRLGFIGSVAALAFFLRALASAFDEVDIDQLLSRHWIAVLSAGLLYGLAYVPMTRAWIVLARGAGARSEPRALAEIFLTSQIAKYLPGNVAQFLGRAYAAHRIGVPLTVTGLALTLEVAGVLIASALLVGCAWSLGLGGSISEAGAVYLLPLAGAVIAAVAAIAVIAGRRDGIHRSVRSFIAATLLHMLTLLLVAGGHLVIAVSLVGHANAAMIGEIAAAILTSWMIGFAAPGAPAGLGLREMTFVAMLSGSYAPGALVLAAAAFRLVTVGGDLLAWLVGLHLSTARGQAASRLASN